MSSSTPFVILAFLMVMCFLRMINLADGLPTTESLDGGTTELNMANPPVFDVKTTDSSTADSTMPTSLTTSLQIQPAKKKKKPNRSKSSSTLTSTTTETSTTPVDTTAETTTAPVDTTTEASTTSAGTTTDSSSISAHIVNNDPSSAIDNKKHHLGKSDTSVEEISTANLPDEATFNLNRQVQKCWTFLLNLYNKKKYSLSAAQTSILSALLKQTSMGEATKNAMPFPLEYDPSKPLALEYNPSKPLPLEYHPSKPLPLEYHPSKPLALEYDPDHIFKTTTIETKPWVVYNKEEALAQVRKVIDTDLDDINRQLEPFYPMTDEAIFREHSARASAFTECCMSNSKLDYAIKLKHFVDAYGSVGEQMKIIRICAYSLRDKNLEICNIHLSKVKMIRKEVTKYVAWCSVGNETTDGCNLQRLDTAVRPLVNMKNVVYDYNQLNQRCDPALTLLWDPQNLRTCENDVRSSFKLKTSLNDYLRIKKEHLDPFLNMALNLMTNVKIVWTEISEQVKKNKEPHDVLSDERIQKDIEKIEKKNMIIFSNTDHPMLQHYAKRAHAYRVCCRPIETTTMFEEYLNNFEDVHQGHLMHKLLTNCVRQQVPSSVDAMTVENECSTAYNQLTDSMQDRQNFINKHGKLNPHMIDDVQKAISLNNTDDETIPKMSEYVNKYCPDHHVFELMFDLNSNTNCEKTIRQTLGKMSVEQYTNYNNNISSAFRQTISAYMKAFLSFLKKLKLVSEHEESHSPYNLEADFSEDNHDNHVETMPISEDAHDTPHTDHDTHDTSNDDPHISEDVPLQEQSAPSSAVSMNMIGQHYLSVVIIFMLNMVFF